MVSWWGEQFATARWCQVMPGTSQFSEVSEKVFEREGGPELWWASSFGHSQVVPE